MDKVVARLARIHLNPNVEFEVRIIVEQRRSDGKIYLMFVDQNKHLIYATDVLRDFINRFGLEENVITQEDLDNSHVFKTLFNKTPMGILRTDSNRNLYIDM